MNKEFIQRLTEIVEANLANEAFGIEDVVKEMGMSHSNLHRRLKIASNQSISQFIREIRLKKAKELLQNEELTVSEISYRVGFGSPTYFNKCFHEYFGYSPGELKIRELTNKQIENQVTESITKKRKARKPLMLMSFVFVLILIAIFFIFKGSPLKSVNSQAKSIAVLPFKYLSGEPDKQYLSDGMMDALLLNLSKIKDLRVISRTSVEQFRSTTLSSRTIGHQLGVAYTLETTFQKDKDKVRLIIQLIRTRDEAHAWSKKYDINWEDQFSLQSEIAETIANELHAAITPEERQLIRKMPTVDLTAYDFYQQGHYEYLKFTEDTCNWTAHEKANNLYHKALQYDSTFAQAYAGLAWLYIYKNWNKNVFSSNFLDSVLIRCNRALQYDPHLADAYLLRGMYYEHHGDMGKALEEFESAIKFDPNDGKAYLFRGVIMQWTKEDYVEAIKCYHEGALRNRGKDLAGTLKVLGELYRDAGFTSRAAKYFKEALELDGDSANYFDYLGLNEFCSENFENALNFANKAYKINSDYVYNLLFYCSFTDRNKEAIRYAEKYAIIMNTSGDFSLSTANRIGYAFWQVGKQKEALSYFNKHTTYCLESIKLERFYARIKSDYYDLAGTYAFIKDKDNAYRYLDEWNKKKVFPLGSVITIKHDPLFKFLRGEPRFQALLKDAEAKFNKEHERVRKWLEKEGML